MRRPIKITMIFVIFAGIYLILPYFFGMAAKNSTLAFVNNENQSLGKVLGLHFDIQKYNRGWFHSTATLQVEKRDATGNWAVIKNIPLVIDHGPTYRVDGHYQSGLGMIKSDGLQLDNDFPYQIIFRDNIGFTGERGSFAFLSKKANASGSGFQAGSLVLNTRSNLKATHFEFDLKGQGLHYQDLQQSLSADIQNLDTTLTADYVSDRHWQITLGLGLDKSQLTTTLPNSASMVTVNADQIDLSGAHFDTQEIAKVLAEVVQLKQSADEQKPMKPTAWMALLQQFLTQIIHKDTSAEIKGLSFTTPMGQVSAQYVVSFPTLNPKHDYFDVATRNVGDLQINIPSWKFTNADKNTEFSLSNLQYNEQNNTVFSRHSKLTLGGFDIRNLQATQKTPVVYATGFTYEGALNGDPKHLSQVMDWDLTRLCFSDNCFNKIHGKLELMHMNFDAFRGIAAATQQIVQFDPQETESVSARWMELAQAYVKLISPQTQLVLSHNMMTPVGDVQVHGELSWPGLAESTASASPALPVFLDQAVYQLHLIFPAAYVNAFLDQQANAPAPVATTAPAKPGVAANPTAVPATVAAAPAATKTPAFEVQAAQFVQYAITQGYLKKAGDAYTVDLAGKGSVLTINNIPWKMPG